MSASGITLAEILGELERSAAVPERPQDSVTAAELAARTGLSECHCRHLLERDKRLKKVTYLTENRKRAACYVPA